MRHLNSVCDPAACYLQVQRVLSKRIDKLVTAKSKIYLCSTLIKNLSNYHLATVLTLIKNKVLCILFCCLISGHCSYKQTVNHKSYRNKFSIIFLSYSSNDLVKSHPICIIHEQSNTARIQRPLKFYPDIGTRLRTRVVVFEV